MKMIASAPAALLQSLLILLLSEPVTCFHTKQRGHSGGYIYTSTSPDYCFLHHHRHHHVESSDAKATPCIDSLREEDLRQEATDALLPVLFPKIHHFSNRTKPITAETSLKKLLRKQRTENSSRGRLAALTLGTSVMRLRHWYAVASRNAETHPDKRLLIPYPLDPSLITLVYHVNNTFIDGENDNLELSQSSTNDEYSAEERLLAREMIDEHAHYLSLLSPADHTLPTLQSTPSIDTSTKLSIHYSIPAFVTKLLLSQYGYGLTKKICSLMNDPGPITIRRNAIQFAGTDQDLCDYLWKEDGVRAKPLSTLLGGSYLSHDHSGEKDHNMIKMTPTTDGSNRYLVGSLADSGSIVPPEGAIKILPHRSNATTTVEQRRSNKSIWSMKGWQHGYFEVQDSGSQVIVQSMEVSPGESILDYCAGNGGKTFAISSAIMNAASISNDTGSHSQIVAHDVVDERLRQIKGSLPRVGFVAHDGDGTLKNTTHRAQSSKCSIQIAASSDLDAADSSTPSFFDAVLVDAPCSSIGVLRRRPSQRWDLTEEQIKELPYLQLEILEKAAPFVKEDGGKLVYSTCSLLREENEDVVMKFEQSSTFLEGGFKRWGFTPATGNGIDGNDRLKKENFHTITLLPSEKWNDGFFIARWKREAKLES